MRYDVWFKKHQHKHQQILAKLKDKSMEEVIDYFDYENMRIYEKEFCPLYSQNKKCHDMKMLNCYLCGCPHFLFDDEGIERVGNAILYSKCTIECKDGKKFVTKEKIHQDCSNCTLPHRKGYIKKHFSRDWESSMKE